MVFLSFSMLSYGFPMLAYGFPMLSCGSALQRAENPDKNSAGKVLEVSEGVGSKRAPNGPQTNWIGGIPREILIGILRILRDSKERLGGEGTDWTSNPSSQVRPSSPSVQSVQPLSLPISIFRIPENPKNPYDNFYTSPYGGEVYFRTGL